MDVFRPSYHKGAHTAASSNPPSDWGPNKHHKQLLLNSPKRAQPDKKNPVKVADNRIAPGVHKQIHNIRLLILPPGVTEFVF